MLEKYATIEILEEGEEVFGPSPAGRYMVREFEGDEEIGGEFYESILQAEKHVLKFQGENDED